MSHPRLGIDFGRVIADVPEPRPKTRDSFFKMPLIVDAVGSLIELQEIFQQRIYIVSRCTKEREQWILEYLEQFKILSALQITILNVFFCRERSEKAAIAETLRLTHFVDDHLEILSSMSSVSKRYALNPPIEELQTYDRSRIDVVISWKEIVSSIQKDHAL